MPSTRNRPPLGMSVRCDLDATCVDPLQRTRFPPRLTCDLLNIVVINANMLRCGMPRPRVRAGTGVLRLEHEKLAERAESIA